MQKNITASGANQVIPGYAKEVIVTVNAALTGNIVVKDSGTDDTGPVIATITNPTVGSRFRYGDFRYGVRVNPSATCDITVIARAR